MRVYFHVFVSMRGAWGNVTYYFPLLILPTRLLSFECYHRQTRDAFLFSLWFSSQMKGIVWQDLDIFGRAESSNLKIKAEPVARCFAFRVHRY